MKRVKQKILVIEDDRKLSIVLQRELGWWGYEAYGALDGETGYNRILDEDFAVIICDISLPKLNGIEIIKKVRSQSIHVPFITITNFDKEKREQKIFESGANLFHTKPINYDLLKAQLNMLVESAGRKRIVQIADLKLDPNSWSTTIRGKTIKLSKKEFALLYSLMKAPGDVLSRNEIISQLKLGNYEAEQGTVDTLVSRLRKKLAHFDSAPVVETVYGVGYRLNSNYFVTK